MSWYEQLSRVLFWTGLDPDGRLDSGQPRDRSTLWGKWAGLVSLVLRMLENSLGVGTVRGLWTKEVDSDLNLEKTQEEEDLSLWGGGLKAICWDVSFGCQPSESVFQSYIE